jgi:hypothetical protein
MERWLAATQAEVEAVESVLTGLTFNLVNSFEAQFSWAMVFGIATSIWPAI